MKSVVFLREGSRAGGSGPQKGVADRGDLNAAAASYEEYRWHLSASLANSAPVADVDAP